MTGRTEIERALDGYLAEGPETVADRALMHALDAIDRTPQRRDLFAPRRFTLMITFSRMAAAVLVAVIALGGAIYLLGQHPAVGTSSPAPSASQASPNPSPSLAAAASPAASIDTSQWFPFTSAFYGFSVSRPQNWIPTPGSGHWSLAAQNDAAVDTLFSPSGWPDFKGYEAKIPAGMTAAAFIQSYTADATVHACYPGGSAWTQTTVDGHPATIAYAGCNEHFYYAQATVVIGDRIWFFDLDGPDRTLIVPFLSTVKIDPTKVVD